jgi:hypothetical protein
MNALRQIVKSTGGSITIDLPKEFQKTSLEIIIIPIVDDNGNQKDPVLLNKAHATIDAGCSDLTKSFIESFENSLRDRELPRI